MTGHMVRISTIGIGLATMATVARAQSTYPKRDVADPGIIATGARVTPAGVQSVFEGKVAGVRFGAASDEVWVAVPGYVYRLDWRGNTVRARARVDGRPGVHALGLWPPEKIRINCCRRGMVGSILRPCHDLHCRSD